MDDKLFRYGNGFIIGFCTEYLYKVGYNLYAVIILCIVIIATIIDLRNNK